MYKKPTISVIATAYRTYWWMEIYNSFITNKVSFEIIFVGHVKPDFKLPKNFKFIYTKVKPAQCLEIAFRNATGDFVINIADDCIFYNKFLDNLYNKMTMLIKKKRKVVLSPIQMKNKGGFVPNKKYCFWPDDRKSPMLPFSSMMKREDWKNLGGIDKNFIAIFGDLDISMRMIESGGRIFFCKEAIFEERPRKRSVRKNLGHTNIVIVDRIILESFWVKKIKFKKEKFNKDRKKIYKLSKMLSKKISKKEYLFLNKELRKRKYKFFKKYGINDPLNILYVDKKKGIIFKKRLCSVEPFNDKEILFFSQGKKDNKWK